MSSELKDLCRKIYQARIQDPLLKIPDELRRSLASHERVPVFIDRLSQELGNLQFDVKRETIEDAVRAMTDFFVANIKRAADERAMSLMGKLLLKQKAQEKKEISDLADAVEKVGIHNVTQDTSGTTDRSSIEITERLLD